MVFTTIITLALLEKVKFNEVFGRESRRFHLSEYKCQLSKTKASEGMYRESHLAVKERRYNDSIPLECWKACGFQTC